MASSRNSYLVDRQTDPDRLKRIAFEEFWKAHATGRLVAFLGSYATEFLGYGSWNELTKAFFAQQRRIAPLRKRQLIDHLKKPGDPKDPTLDPLVRMDLAQLATGLDRRSNPVKFRDERKNFMKGFHLKGSSEDVNASPAIVRTLIEQLDLNRFMTLNYDLEIEWELLTSEKEKKLPGPREKIFFKIRDRGDFSPGDQDSPHCPDARLERYLLGRGRVVSDVLDRQRSEILTEFALGASWPEKRILHLHGRADEPDNLIVTKRDYRDRYWEAGFSKLPFEYGMRLIFSANPVLFVGIGAREPEVMRTLEQFLSDNPNRRAVPAFLLWNYPDDEDAGKAEAQAQVRRLGLYRQYGIHVLFDRDIAAMARCPKYDKRIRARLAAGKAIKPKALLSARRLEEPIRLLGEIRRSGDGDGAWTDAELRSPQDKVDSINRNPDESNRIDMWLQIGGPQSEFRNEALAGELLASGSPIKAIIGEAGSGRGGLAKAIASALAKRSGSAPFRQPDRVVLINGSFAIETDSIFGILSGAADNNTAQKEGQSRVQALMRVVSLLRTMGLEDLVRAFQAPPSAAEPGDRFLNQLRRVTIIVNSMERFIGHDGSALSAELDNLIRILIHFYHPEEGFRQKWGRLAEALSPDLPEDRLDYPINLILLGTPRIRRYLGTLSRDIDYLAITSKGSPPSRKALVPDGELTHGQPEIEFTDCRNYFQAVSDAFGREDLAPAPGMEKLAARRYFLGWVLKEETLRCLAGENQVENPLLCLEILRTLAFVGQPVEQEVLRHVPKIWELTEKHHPQTLPPAVHRALKDLKRLKLILPLKPFVANGLARFGLHKAVIAEFRERFGVPLSDARLSGGFNLSLTAAQAVDSAAPEVAWHDDLGQLVDLLAGAFFDSRQRSGAGKIAKIIEAKRRYLPADLQWYKLEQLAEMASAEYSACLRAALAIMRSYYSVPALLMQANRNLDPWMRDGPLSEHAERLARLLRMGKNAATIRALVRTGMSEASGPETGAGDAAKALGPNAFYPDDLVWLHNELGVVRATQGSLFEAEHEFREAHRINERWVECGHQQQNWRRIQLNLVQVGIDRGDIEGSEERLRGLDAALEVQAAMVGPSDQESAWQYILRRFGGDSRKSVDSQLLPVRIDERYPTDLILTAALILGFRGQCMHLRGALDAAKTSFSDALAILMRLNELRAYAYFQRQAAALYAALHDKEAARQGLRLCIAAAGPSRQTDIDHSGRVALVQYDLIESVATRPPWIMQLNESLRYATAGDMFRLQLECMQALAQVHLRHGDTDSALRYTNDAMAVAARCGFDLRAVSLRILMARILAFRGDKESARSLLSSAESIAAKMKYERAVEAAEDQLIRLG